MRVPHLHRQQPATPVNGATTHNSLSTAARVEGRTSLGSHESPPPTRHPRYDAVEAVTRRGHRALARSRGRGSALCNNSRWRIEEDVRDIGVEKRGWRWLPADGLVCLMELPGLALGIRVGEALAAEPRKADLARHGKAHCGATAERQHLHREQC